MIGTSDQLLMFVISLDHDEVFNDGTPRATAIKKVIVIVASSAQP
ncbi:hypothetical protein [Pseudomonas svalbardensis]|nr:hypothetical protein [Pseudomonas sp. PMCC200367]